MAVAVSVVHRVRGGDARELTGEISGVKLSQAAVGGFGSAEFSMAGDKRNRLGYLGIIKFFHGSSLLWEGQLEDQGVTFDESTRTTHVRAFGLRRKFDETSVRRIWSKRDIDLVPAKPGLAAATFTVEPPPINTIVAVGNYDPTDLTKSGVQVQGSGTLANNLGNGGYWPIPAGLTIVKVLASYDEANPAGFFLGSIHDSTARIYSNGGVTGTGVAISSSAVSASAMWLLFGAQANSTVGLTTANFVNWYNIRLLGTSVVEDAVGGFYGGTILRDLISLCPELTAGIIEDGSDFLIEAIERSVRSAMADVRDEVVGYYTREWAVWEDGRFDWKTRNLDEPQWIVALSDLSQLSLDASVDDIARTVYVLYTDAASGLDAEASASATDQRNPYARQGKTKDMIVTPGFPMTANTSQQLAARIAGDAGARPSVGGTCVIAADRMIRNAVGEPKPAALIRAGENVSFPELPKTDVMLRGRDGETLFHVASVELDVDNNAVTLTLEGQQRRTDVILARLALATRVLTG